MKKLTLTFLLLTLITPLYGADPKSETMLDRDEGIALFKQLLTDLNKGEMKKPFLISWMAAAARLKS